MSIGLSLISHTVETKKKLKIWHRPVWFYINMSIGLLLISHTVETNKILKI